MNLKIMERASTVRSQTLYPAELWARQTVKLSTGIRRQTILKG